MRTYCAARNSVISPLPSNSASNPCVCRSDVCSGRKVYQADSAGLSHYINALRAALCCFLRNFTPRLEMLSCIRSNLSDKYRDCIIEVAKLHFTIAAQAGFWRNLSRTAPTSRIRTSSVRASTPSCRWKRRQCSAMASSSLL